MSKLLEQMRNELTFLLENDESNDAPYNMEEDKSAPKLKDKRKKTLKLKDVNRLKKIRNQKREELAQDSVFVPLLYGPEATPQEQGPGGGMM